MKNKPLSPEEIAAAKRLVADKTFPLRVRFFAQWCLTVLLWLGALALLGYGGFSVWSLVYTQQKADHLHHRLQEHIKETQRESEQ